MNGFAPLYQTPIAEQRTHYGDVEVKSEPFELSHQRTSYSYPAQNSYSEQELAESLGWVDYTYNPQASMPATHQMQLSNEMTMQRNSLHNRAPSSSVHQTGSLASNGTFGSVSIPQTSHSPAGWHSSMESPNFLAEANVTRTLSTNYQGPSSSSSKQDGSTVAEKKAMRRYSHNAGTIIV